MNVFSISRAERETSPVFIIGEARSGTTMLYRILQKHSAFAPRKSNLWESKLMNHVDAATTFRPGEPRPMLGYMSDDSERYAEFLASLRPLRPALHAGRAARRLVRSHARRVDQVWAASGYPLVVRSYFHHARLARGVERILEKTPTHVHHVDRLLHCYPNARLIYLHRHPVDVYSSYVRRSQVDPNARWTRIPVGKFASQWTENTTAALDAADRLPESLLLVRYEEFTADPDTLASRICEFVGEPYDPEIVIERDPAYGKRKAAPHLFSDITTKTKEWQDYLSGADAAKLQKRVRPVMKRLGYDPYPTRAVASS